MHFLTAGALDLQHRGLEHAAEGERLFGLLLPPRELLDAIVQVRSRSLRSCGRSAPQAARIRSLSWSWASA